MNLKIIPLFMIAMTSVEASVFADPITVPINRIPILPAVVEVPCKQVLEPYFNWASGATQAYEDVRGVSFTLVYNQNRNSSKATLDDKQNVVGYQSGGLKFSSNTLTGDVTALFSDRTYCPPNPGGGLCVESDPFNPKQADLVGITLTQDGLLTSVLKSWGNSVYKDQLVCFSNGILYAPPKLGQRSMAVVTLQKTGYRTPR